MTVHPLESLTADEIARAVEILRGKEDRVEDSMLIARVVLDEPTKDELAHGDVERRAAITVVPGPGADLLEAVVSLTDELVSSCVELQLSGEAAGKTLVAFSCDSLRLQISDRVLLVVRSKRRSSCCRSMSSRRRTRQATHAPADWRGANS